MWVCRKLNISRATFYRHKKKLHGEMVITKRQKRNQTCNSCGNYKMRATFYNWFHNPAISFMGDERIGIICMPCAKREAGSKLWGKMKNG